MAVPGVVLLIPKFLVLNYLGMYNTYPALIVPLLVDAAGVFIMKQFFEHDPGVRRGGRPHRRSRHRSGPSGRIVLPMAKPALITMTILSLPGLVERAAALHHRRPRPRASSRSPVASAG